MRVIAGEQKGISLKSVPGITTRPTSDKVRGSIFNSIGPYFEGGMGLDLFAGSGALGIEALSRGLSKVIFVDRDFHAIQTIKENIKRTHAVHKAEIYRTNANLALKALKKRDAQFSYVFLDPPYNNKIILDLIKNIQIFNLLLAGGQIVVEHSNKLSLPETIEEVTRKKYGVYGNTAISIYTKEE